MEKRPRLQSAMEYLMTYGWSILIIAVVLAALFSLGVFNPSNFAPTVPPGSCRVFRPYGSKSSAGVNLEGTCNNELPEYVLQVQSATTPVTVNVANAFPTISSTSGAITITEWVYMSQQSGYFYAINYPNYPFLQAFDDGSCSGPQYLPIVWFLPGGSNWHDECNQPSPMPINQWIFLAGSFNALILSGTLGASGTLYTGGGIGSQYLVGNTITPTTFFPIVSMPIGSEVSNVQVYNTTLDAGSIQALYDEGIGGAPVSPQYLIGWWPLNGNLNDYSGEGLTGVTANAFAYSGGWASTYSPP